MQLGMGQYEDDGIYFKDKEDKKVAAKKDRRLGEEGGHNSNCNIIAFIR